MNKNYRKPLLALFVLAPFMAETAASSNVPFIQFLNPLVLLWLCLIYGTAAILGHELWARGRIGTKQFIVLGAAFAALNEGVIANSWFKPGALDLSTAEAGRFLGVNWHLVVGLITFHTFVSLLMPTVLIGLTFRGVMARPWLTSAGMTTAWLVLLTTGLAVLLPHTAGGDLQPQFAYRFGLLILIAFAVWWVLRRPVEKISLNSGPTLRLSRSASLMTGFGFTLCFWLLFFAVPHFLPYFSVLLGVGLYYFLGKTLLSLATQSGWRTYKVLDLIAGVMILPVIVSFIRIGYLQPLAEFIFLAYLYWLYNRNQVKQAGSNDSN
jgi:hypothetical protein